MQRVLLVVDDDGVTGVVAAVVLHHVVDPRPERVGRLALALVTPLGADHDDRWHQRTCFRLSPRLRLRWSLDVRETTGPAWATLVRLPPPQEVRVTTTHQRVLVLANDQAGSSQQDAQEAALEVLRAMGEVELVCSSGVDDLTAALARADGRRVVVMGGDGTVHAVAQVLHRTGRMRDVGPVALVPMGTGNDLARSLNLPLDDPARAAEIAMTGRVRDLEVLLDDAGVVVVNAVHVGVGAEAGAKAEGAKHALGHVGLGKVAYPLGAVAAGATSPGWALRVTLDGKVLHDGDPPTLLVALGVGTSVGGGAPLSPHADPFDGQVDVTVSTATGPLARVGYAASIRGGTHVDRADTVTGRGKELLVESLDGEPFRCNADGEVSDPVTRRSWRVLPAAWQLVTGPADDPPGDPDAG